jgi:glycosyltransferase involved in cell wall biosynthesis
VVSEPRAIEVLRELLESDREELSGGVRQNARLSRDLTVFWTGPLRDRSGYADEAKLLIRGLRNLGFSVLTHSVKQQHDTPMTGDQSTVHQRERVVSPHHHVVHVVHLPWADPFPSVPADRVIWRTMFETDGLPPSWVQRSWQVDEIWVPSSFNLGTFANAGVPPSKLRVLHEPIDTERFDPARANPLEHLPREAFIFLSVFTWQQRKGWDVLLQAYLEEFSGRESVVLVIRTDRFPRQYHRPSEEIGRLREQFGGGDPPPISLLPPVTTRDMPRLYASADAFVLASHGEGWGRPLMEAMCMGLPTIGTRWGGSLEFMNEKNSYLVDCELKDVSEAAAAEYPLFSGQRWAQASIEHLRSLMRHVYEDREDAATRGARARREVVARFDVSRIAVDAALNLQLPARAQPDSVGQE